MNVPVLASLRSSRSSAWASGRSPIGATRSCAEACAFHACAFHARVPHVSIEEVRTSARTTAAAVAKGRRRMLMNRPKKRDGQYTIRAAVTQVPTVRPSKAAAKKPSSSRLAFLRRRGWKFYVALGILIPFVIFCSVVTYYYIGFSRLIDARMHGE